MREATVRWCEHGESVRDGKTNKGCSGCVAGICGAALACELPEDPFPTPSRWARLRQYMEEAMRAWRRSTWRRHRRASIVTPFD